MQITKDNRDDLLSLVETMKERNEKEYDWTKQVIVVLSTILGLLIALKSTSSKNEIEHIIFSVAILSNALCILSGLIFLHRETATLHSLIQKYITYIKSPDANRRSELIISAPKRYYDISKVFFVIFLFLSVASLISFAIYSDQVQPKPLPSAKLSSSYKIELPTP